MGNSASNKSKQRAEQSASVPAAATNEGFDLNKLNLLRGQYLSRITAALTEKKPEEAKTHMISFISAACDPENQARLPDSVSQLFSGLKWFNTASKALSFTKELRGKVVLLDFWTYCCIKFVRPSAVTNYAIDLFSPNH